jgi:hypothetical protein
MRRACRHRAPSSRKVCRHRAPSPRGSPPPCAVSARVAAVSARGVAAERRLGEGRCREALSPPGRLGACRRRRAQRGEISPPRDSLSPPSSSPRDAPSPRNAARHHGLPVFGRCAVVAQSARLIVCSFSGDAPSPPERRETHGLPVSFFRLFLT